MSRRSLVQHIGAMMMMNELETLVIIYAAMLLPGLRSSRAEKQHEGAARSQPEDHQGEEKNIHIYTCVYLQA